MKKVHMIKREIEPTRFSPRKHAEGVCGTTTRSMKNATYDVAKVTCQFCLGKLGSKHNG